MELLIGLLFVICCIDISLFVMMRESLDQKPTINNQWTLMEAADKLDASVEMVGSGHA
jgi:hypothetical protein